MWLCGHFVTIGLLGGSRFVAFVIYVRPKRVWLFGYIWIFTARLFGDSTVSHYAKPSKQIWAILYGWFFLGFDLFFEKFPRDFWPRVNLNDLDSHFRRFSEFDLIRPQTASSDPDSYKYSGGPLLCAPLFCKVPLISYDFPFLKLQNKGNRLCISIQKLGAPYFLRFSGFEMT